MGRPLLPDPERFRELTDHVWSSEHLTNGGPLVRQLEGDIARLLGTRHTVAVSSGTTALMLALALADLPVGGEVITTPLSFAATAQAVSWMGYRPVFADVEDATLTLDPGAVEAALSPATVAILGVHLFGTVCDDAALSSLAARAGIPLIYDAAHAFGVDVDGVGVGTLGRASAFSLHATKLLHTGEGGVVTATSARDESRLRTLANFGLDGHRPAGTGINGKLSEIAAAVGLAVMDRVDAERRARRRLRRSYDQAFEPLAWLRRQPVQPGVSSPELFYAVRVPARVRDRVVQRLLADGIHTRPYFPLLAGPGTAFPDAAVHGPSGGPPRAAVAADEVLCLPFHAAVTQSDVERIATIIAAVER